MVEANINVEEPDLIPFDQYAFYVNLNLYTSLINCGVSVAILLLTLYITCKIWKARRTLNNLPIYFGSPLIQPPTKYEKETNPPYYSTTTT
jgi:hypothetical protein